LLDVEAEVRRVEAVKAEHVSMHQIAHPKVKHNIFSVFIDLSLLHPRSLCLPTSPTSKDILLLVPTLKGELDSSQFRFFGLFKMILAMVRVSKKRLDTAASICRQLYFT